MDWLLLLGLLINSVLALAAVQALKNYVMPFLRTRAKWALPLLAMGAGPVMAYVTEFLVSFTGHPIDLSGITAVFTGTLAVVGYGMARSSGRTKAGKLVRRKKWS